MKIRIVQSFTDGKGSLAARKILDVEDSVAQELIRDGFAIPLPTPTVREKALRTEATNRKKAIATE